MAKGKRIPTKGELLQLQKLYKTDEKIGERLGGVPAYLIAYWRRKKNIPKYSLPKFSETEIRMLWERFGDDEKSGLELGISKAAFYNWRRRYGIREKPAFLKLEQLELNFPGSGKTAHASSLYGKRSVAQKILARAMNEERVDVGSTIDVEPDLALMAGGAADMVAAFREQKVEYVWNPNKLVISLAESLSIDGATQAAGHRLLREFVRRQGIRSLYDLHEGSCHQLLMEKGHPLPGQLIVGYGARSMAYGCLGTLAIPVDDEAMATLWGTGKFSLTVPQTISITLSGRRYRGAYAIDVGLHIIKQLGSQGADDRVVEYAGSVISQMSMGERFALTNLTSMTGALAASCAYDATSRRYVTGRTMSRFQPVLPDKDAEYEGLYQVNIDQLAPLLMSLDKPGEVRAVAEMSEAPLNQVIIGGCTSGRFEDMRVAADVFKGKSVQPECRTFIVPGSRTVYLEALKKGLIRVFVEAGAIVISPSAFPGFLAHEGALAEGERCLTSTMLPSEALSSTAEHLLCSPATAAASALKGIITDPTGYVK